MNTRFTPPQSGDQLLGSVDALLIDLLAHDLVTAGVDLGNEDACRAAALGAGQSASFVAQHLSAIRLVAMMQADRSKGGNA